MCTERFLGRVVTAGVRKRTAVAFSMDEVFSAVLINLKVSIGC